MGWLARRCRAGSSSPLSKMDVTNRITRDFPLTTGRSSTIAPRTDTFSTLAPRIMGIIRWCNLKATTVVLISKHPMATCMSINGLHRRRVWRHVLWFGRLRQVLHQALNHIFLPYLQPLIPQLPIRRKPRPHHPVRHLLPAVLPQQLRLRENVFGVTGREDKNMKVSVLVWTRNIAMNVIEPCRVDTIIQRASSVMGKGIIRNFFSPHT